MKHPMIPPDPMTESELKTMVEEKFPLPAQNTINGWLGSDRYSKAVEEVFLKREGARRALRDHYLPATEEIKRLRADRDNLRNFIEQIIKSECWGRVEYLDGGDVQDEAERFGVLVKSEHSLPCTIEHCGCEGEDLDYLYQFAWHTRPQPQQEQK